MLDYNTENYNELITHLRLAVELVNNKTDGWFDNLQQVTLVVRINDSACDADIALEMLDDQRKWALNVSNGIWN
jgi:hypothetical protein